MGHGHKHKKSHRDRRGRYTKSYAKSPEAEAPERSSRRKPKSEGIRPAMVGSKRPVSSKNAYSTSSSDESMGSSSYSASSSSESTMSHSTSSASNSSDSSSSSSSHSRHRRGPYSFDKAPVIGSAAPVGVAPTATLLPVQMWYKDKLDDAKMKWDKTELLIQVEGSLSDLNTMGSHDKDGNLLLNLGNGVVIERTTTDIVARMVANRHLTSQEAMNKDPHKYIQAKDIVRRVRIEYAHSNFPCALSFAFDNIVGSSQGVVHPNSKARQSNHLSFTVQPRETINGRVVLNTPYSSKDALFYQHYADFDPSNITSDLIASSDFLKKDANGKVIDRIPRCMVPYTEERPHPVVDKIRKHAKDFLSDEQYAVVKETKELPREILSTSIDCPGYYLVSKEHFDRYAKITADGMRSKHPLSDMAHPAGVVGRIKYGDFYAKGKTSKMDKPDPLSSSVRPSNWLDLEEVYVGRVGSESKKSATTTRYACCVRLVIESHATSALGKVDQD